MHGWWVTATWLREPKDWQPEQQKSSDETPQWIEQMHQPKFVLCRSDHVLDLTTPQENSDMMH
jgi:hypothetical protein